MFQAVAEFVRLGTWKHKVAAIMTLSQVAEVVEEETQMDEIVKLLLRRSIHNYCSLSILPLEHMNDPHPRVRYAALHAMGQTATDCTPYVQEAWAQEVVENYRIGKRLEVLGFDCLRDGDGRPHSSGGLPCLCGLRELR